MNKQKINFWVDAVLAVSFVITAVSSLIIFFFLPDGIRQGGIQEFLNVTKRTWSEWHKWSGLIFIAFALLHFILHIDWIKGVAKNLFHKE